MVIYPDLQEKVILITGGASGIGAGLVERFTAQKSKVIFFDNDQNQGNALIQKLNNPDAKFYSVDLSKPAKLQFVVEQALNVWKRADVLINNVANDCRHSFENLSFDQWEAGIAVNLRSHFFMMQNVIGTMKKQNSGSIINVSSNSCLLGLSGYPAYVTAKAGILGLTKAAAREFGEFNIRVNSLIPGWVMTEKQKKLWANKKDVEQCLAEQCLKRTMDLKDICLPALFLASESSAMMTAQNLIIDGGRT